MSLLRRPEPGLCTGGPWGPVGTPLGSASLTPGPPHPASPSNVRPPPSHSQLMGALCKASHGGPDTPDSTHPTPQRPTQREHGTLFTRLLKVLR